MTAIAASLDAPKRLASDDDLALPRTATSEPQSRAALLIAAFDAVRAAGGYLTFHEEFTRGSIRTLEIWAGSIDEAVTVERLVNERGTWRTYEAGRFGEWLIVVHGRRESGGVR